MTIPYVCDNCKKPIENPREALFYITTEDMHAAQRWVRDNRFKDAKELEESYGGNLPDSPEDGKRTFKAKTISDITAADFPPAAWHVRHFSCCHPDGTRCNEYTVSQISDHRGLLQVYVHLQEKMWVEGTNLRQWVEHYAHK